MSSFEEFQKTELSQSNPSFIQEAIVKDNRDPKKMGRLKVWIVGSSSPEDNKSGWITCDYATPFGGRTQGEPFATKFEDYPMSYGFWGVPPDINVRVFVFFVNGRLDKAYWFGCAYDYGMTNNVPGPKTKTPSIATIDAPLPVTEYDRNSMHSAIDAEYPNVNLIDGLRRQRMLYDYDMSTADRSSSRQVPYMVYGLSSPRGNHIVLDDGYIEGEEKSQTWDDNPDEYQNTEQGSPSKDTVLGDRKYEGILLRTRSGGTIMISESKGNIFIINRDGTARIELDPDGNITLLGDRDVSIRAKRDVNILAERDYNVDVLGNYNLRVKGAFKQDLSSLDILNSGTINWQSSSSFNLQTSSLSTNISGSILVKGGSISLISGSGIAMSGGGGTMSVSSSMNFSGAIHAGDDVTTPSVSLNSHRHNHGDPIVSVPITGSGSSPSIQSPQSAGSVSVSSLGPSAYNDVIEVQTESAVGATVINDIGKVSDKSLSALCYMMPVTGTIQKYGYWGENITQLDGTTDNNTGWTIDLGPTDVDVISVANGVIKYSSGTLFIVDHQDGYESVYDGIKLSTDSQFKEGKEITAGTVFGKAKNTMLFEIRKNTSSLAGFEGTVDPGLFYIEITSTGSDSSNKQLTQSQTSNPVCAISNSTGYTSSGLVKITGIDTIITTLPLSGSLNDPSSGAIISSNTTSKTGVTSGTVSLPDDQEPLKSDPTPIDWIVEADDAQLNREITADEGGKGIQTRLGYYRNNRFWVYRDTRGYPTIGIGHLVTAGENFGAGLTDDECAALLQKDLIKHVRNAKAIACQYNMKIPYQAQQVLVQACYQLGPGGLRKFKTFLSLMSQGKYSAAGDALKASAWYRQTPNRVNRHIAKLKGLGS